jgi:carbohydrate-selective porin OprB
MLGAGVVWAQLFQGGENRELVIECFYKAELTPRFRIQPDVQYVVSPSGIHRDALAVGTRFEVVW